jgi:hypothetical protein
MFLLSGFVMPCVMLCLKAIHTRLLAADESARTNGRTGTKTGIAIDTIQTRLIAADNSTGTNTWGNTDTGAGTGAGTGTSTSTSTSTGTGTGTNASTDIDDTDTGTSTSTSTSTGTSTGTITGAIAGTSTDIEQAAAASAPASAANHLRSSSTHAAALVVERLLDPLLRPIVAQSDGKSSPKQGVELGALFRKIQFQTQLINAATLLLTFGLVFPPLAVVICVAVVSETCFKQVLMARLLAETEAASAATGRLYRQHLERDTEGMFLRK